ncbi:hypothetical protein [Plesiomonas shigelloides]|uniref:hypothetical protein n=1 Tax=Plesiomonas shigelloides TaxID=703 RepID=UPI001E4CCA7F|nr:hypothetical protein [Plesiomonas shigelloides]
MLIQDIPKDCKFWVVRSGDGGVYFNHFVHNSIVAIGHIDGMSFSNSILTNREDALALVLNYKKALLGKKESLASASNKAGQVSRFINGMSIGDIVITLDAKRICVGVIESGVYKSIDDVTIKNADGTVDERLLKYTLRRTVKWGKPQFRNNLPLAINNSFRANQTVFSVDEHWKELNHWLSVAFLSGNDAYISSRIEQTDGINNLDIAQYSIIINKIEAIAETIERNKERVSGDELAKLFKKTYGALREQRTFTVTTQQVFLSPGDLWAKTTGSRKKSILVICTFLVMFDITPTFADKKDQALFDENIDSISLLIDMVKQDENFDAVKSGLALKVPVQKLDKVNSVEKTMKKDIDDDVEPDNFEGI